MAAILPDEIRCVELLAEILGLGGTDRSVSQPALYKALLNSFRVWSIASKWVVGALRDSWGRYH